MRNIMKKFVLLTALVIVVVAGSESVKATPVVLDTGWFTVDKAPSNRSRVYNGSVKVNIRNKDTQSHYINVAGKSKTIKAGQTISYNFTKTTNLHIKGSNGAYDITYKVNKAKKGFEITENYNNGKTNFKVKAAKGYTVNVKAGSKKYTIKSGKTKSLTFNKETIVSIRAKNDKSKRYTSSWTKYTVRVETRENAGFDPEKYGKMDFENGATFASATHNTSFHSNKTDAYVQAFVTTDNGNTWSSNGKATLTKSKYEGSETFTIGMYVVADGVKSTTKWYTLTLSLSNPVDRWYTNNSGAEPVKYLSLENAVNKWDGHIYDWESVALNAFDVEGMEYQYSKYTTDGSDPRTSATAKILDKTHGLDYGVETPVYHNPGMDIETGAYSEGYWETMSNYLKTIKIAPYYVFGSEVKSEPLPMHVQSFDVNVITQDRDIWGTSTTFVDGVPYDTLCASMGGALVSSAPYAIHSYTWNGQSAINVPVGETVRLEVGASHQFSTFLYGENDTDEAHARERGKKATIKRVTDMSKLSQY